MISMCRVCNIEFNVKPAKVKAGGGKFCSRECYGVHRSQQMKGSNHFRWSQTKRNCEICQVEFLVTRSQIESGRGRFCSRKCQGAWQSRARSGENHPNWLGGKVKSVCELCKKEFEIPPSRTKSGRGRFCSRRCQEVGVGKSQRGEKNPGWNRVSFLCEQCGCTVEVVPHLVKDGKRFCSKACYGLSICGENHHNWNDGASYKPYPVEFNNSLKKLVRERDTWACFICGILEREKNHHVHHIDHDKQNNTISNLITLCVSCHGRAGGTSSSQLWQELLTELLLERSEGVIP